MLGVRQLHKVSRCVRMIGSLAAAPHNTSASQATACIISAIPMTDDSAGKFGNSNFPRTLEVYRRVATPALITQQKVPLEYRLPTVVKHNIYKHTILDPSSSPNIYKLPTLSQKEIEMFTPSLFRIEVIEDPSPLQKIIDQGSPVLRKETMPWLVNIRKRKMKKHKLKKLRKRMIFLNRKLAEIRKRKKEKEMREIESNYRRRGEEYDPEKYVEEQLRLAKKGGWRIDAFETFTNDRR